MGCSKDACFITRRYAPPVRTSISQETMVMPNDFGVHQRWNSSGLRQASNTMRAGALNVRVTVSSRSDVRSDVVGFFTVSLFAPMGFLLLFQFLDDRVEFVEARCP